MKASALSLLAAVMLVALPVPSQAQERDTATSSKAIVRLTDGSGPVKGRLLDVSPETIALLVKGQRVEIPMDSVKVVSVGGDPLGNGAAIGAGIAGGLLTLECLSGGCEAEAIPMIAIWTGLGALMGAGVDAMVSKETIVYRKDRPALPAGPRPTIGFTVRF